MKDLEMSMEMPRAPWRRLLIPMMLLAVLTLAGCDLIPTPPSIIVQGHGLPTLRHLDWGFSSIQHPVQSPDGHWVAVLAGDDYAGAHVEVVSPDGHTRYDLSGWGCGEGPDPDYGWLPDGRLSCINRDTPYPRMCIGAAPFTSCIATYLTEAIDGGQRGLAWTTDGRFALFPAWPNNVAQDHSDLYVLALSGKVLQNLPFSDEDGVADPSFRPHTAELAYDRGAYVDEGGLVHFDLVISKVTQDITGKLTLGAARTITTEQIPDASSYTWSPSGRWLAIRSNDYHGGDQSADKISLINANNPQQIVDVALVDLTEQWMADPIWSPDGKTLIVISASQPYAIDIAGFLASKGLQP